MARRVEVAEQSMLVLRILAEKVDDWAGDPAMLVMCAMLEARRRASSPVERRAANAMIERWYRHRTGDDPDSGTQRYWHMTERAINENAGHDEPPFAALGRDHRRQNTGEVIDP